MLVKQILTIAICACSASAFSQGPITLDSPSGAIRVEIQTGDSVRYSVHVDGMLVMRPSPVGLMGPGLQAGIGSRLLRTETRSVHDTIVNPVPYKRRNIPDHFNEVTLRFRGKFSLIFRAYDDGIAYRFVSAIPDTIEITREIATFRFHQPDTVYFPQVSRRPGLDVFHTSFESTYEKKLIKDLSETDVAFSPVLIDGKIKTLVTESDLFDYPGMFLQGGGGNELRGLFAPYPSKEEVQGGEFRQPVVTSRDNYLARSWGERTFPWRVLVFARKDNDLLTNDLVYRLGRPPSHNDWFWVTPGISTEEWIIGSNVYGVQFKSGINTATYKYYIDFANRFGLQFVMLDAGWSDPDDLFRIHPDINLEEIASYARSKNVYLTLWTLSMTLDRQLEQALEMFSRLGVKCIMTDFMDRDDQKMVNFYHRVAEATARHRIMVMFHGAFKNAGFERTYPHAITREGVLGSEFNIWSNSVTPEHDLQLPFIRMVSGPMDYEPGFMRNVNRRTFTALPDLVMSQGTRAHQLAMFVAYESPLQMFSGNPSDALAEEEYMTFLASLPTVWDETVALDSRLGDYLVIARRNGNDWYVTAMTDWSAREIETDLTFLGEGQYEAFICEDGVNAEQHGSDYRLRKGMVDRSGKLVIRMAPGGGYVAKLIRK